MVPIPVKLRQRPKWHGLPIPFTTFIGPDGQPDFKVNDIQAVHSCLMRKLCGLCGQPLKKPIVVIGGDLCAENRVFIDPPMHEGCALYACKVCPYLANAEGKYSSRPPKHLEQGDCLHREFEQVSPVRPNRLGVFYIGAYEVVQERGMFMAKVIQIFRVDWDQMPPSI